MTYRNPFIDISRNLFSHVIRIKKSTAAFFSQHFKENARLLQWLIFFLTSTRSFHFFVHLFNIINLNYGRPEHTGNDRTSSKTALCDFFEVFWIPPKGLPFVCSDIFQHNGCQKIPKGPPFTFFGSVTLFKNFISEVF